MKTIYLVILSFFLAASLANSQPTIWSQGFEAFDSLTLPPGWANYNHSTADTIDPLWNWTVRSAGSSLPGLSTSLSVAHGGTKSIGASWWCGVASGLSDVWLVTQKLRNIPSDGLFSFYLTGGSNSYSDSVQMWVTTGSDSTPNGFLANPSNYNQVILFPVGSTYGLFQQYFVDLAPYAGQNIFVAFRYYMDCSVNGYYVQLDDVLYQGTVGITPLGTNIPAEFSLKQNYPNPFNPTTKINFDLAKSSHVTLTVYNSLGQLVEKIFEGTKPAGSYQADFNGAALSSGTYYYRLETDFYTETKKMQLVK